MCFILIKIYENNLQTSKEINNEAHKHMTGYPNLIKDQIVVFGFI
jgi:hypothetical protein